MAGASWHDTAHVEVHAKFINTVGSYASVHLILYLPRLRLVRYRKDKD